MPYNISVPHSNEQFVTVRFCKKAQCDITLCYDTFGDPKDPPMLLVMGLNAHRGYYDPPFCEGLVKKGFFVIRFDNRDIGKSTRLDNLGEPNLCCLVCCPPCCSPSEPRYGLEDMAADCVALMEKLDLCNNGGGGVHLVGSSMGGMIAQLVVGMTPPGSVLSLSLIYSSPGGDLPRGPISTWIALGKKPRDGSREAFVDDFDEKAEKVFLPGVCYQKEDAREFAQYLFDEHDNRMFGRQIAAVMLQKPRNDVCRNKIRCPTLIIHGALDTILPVEHGRKLHELIEGSTYIEFADLGHGISRSHRARVVDAIADIAMTKGKSRVGGNVDHHEPLKSSEVGDDPKAKLLSSDQQNYGATD